ncbi:hypothetical protein SDJN02_01840, partial [Cucurbita argyrosperma subsp. argyrosperma]
MESQRLRRENAELRRSGFQAYLTSSLKAEFVEQLLKIRSEERNLRICFITFNHSIGRSEQQTRMIGNRSEAARNEKGIRKFHGGRDCT